MCAQGGREDDKSSLMTKASVPLGGLLMPVVMDSDYPLSHTHLLVLPQACAWSSEGKERALSSTGEEGMVHLTS